MPLTFQIIAPAKIYELYFTACAAHNAAPLAERPTLDAFAQGIIAATKELWGDYIAGQLGIAADVEAGSFAHPTWAMTCGLHHGDNRGAADGE